MFQFERAGRHAEVANGLLAEGKAYRCWATPEELEEMRATSAPAACPRATTAAGATATPAEAPAGVSPVIG